MKMGRRRRINLRFMIFLILSMLLASTVQMVYSIDHNLRPTFMLFAEENAKNLANDVINKAVIEQIAENTNYEDLINFKQQTNGRLTAGYFNMQEAARIQGQVTDNIQKALQNLPNKTISLPLGIATNNSLLASMGPNIPIKITPIGAVKTNIGWETKEAGINQTIHILYLEVDLQTEVVVPFDTQPYDLKTKVPISYLVMMGDVPEMVFNSEGQSVGDINNGSLPPIQLPNINAPDSSTSGSTTGSKK